MVTCQHHSNEQRFFAATIAAIILHAGIWFAMQTSKDIIILPSQINAIRTIQFPKPHTPSPKPLPKHTPVMTPKVIHVEPKPPPTVVQETKDIVEKSEDESELPPVITDVKLIGHRTHPLYPKRSLRYKQEGTTILHALIDTNGKTKDIIIKQSSHHPLLDKSALKAVWKWTFAPPSNHGYNRPIWIEIPIEFKIKR